MGKSTSCFKIIACGGDSQGKDDIHITESKRLNDKQGWSFRKRSNRQRVLSNTVITETPSPGDKGSSDATRTNFQQPANFSILEKDAAIQGPHEIPQLLATENAKESEAEAEAIDVIQIESKVDVGLDESVTVIIQTAIRGCLAQGTLLKLKNVVKLQAAVRGCLVRKHAVGTLRCIQAIIKMQALVRGRLARLALEQLHNGNGCKALEKEKLRNSSVKYVSIEKLLHNSFVRQLLESTPRTKPINIDYDHSKTETTWIWLERWTSFSSVDVLETEKVEFMTEEQERDKEENLCMSQANTGIDSNVLYRSADAITSCGEHVRYESEDNLIVYDMDGSEFQPRHVTSTTRSVGQSWLEDTSASSVKETLMEANSLPMQLVADSQMQCNPHSGKLGTELEQHKSSNRISSSDQLEVKEKKTVFGFRKATNPAFIAAQSKFQELSSMENSGRSISSLSQDTGAEARTDEISSASGMVLREEELNATGDFTPPGSRTVGVGGSECGTELSVTSTLDSPDISEAEAFEYEHGTNVTEVCINDHRSSKNTEIEADNSPTNLASDLSEPVLESPVKPDVFGESIDSIIVDSTNTEVKPEINALDLQREHDVETGNYSHKLSPSTSPRSHVTVLESQGTPSSQISQKSNKKKTDRSRSNHKHKPPSSGKKSLLNLHQNSDSSNHLEHSVKDEKNGNRRNSFGSARPDHIEEESRESSSNQSVPHFMRATESARAKAQLNNSPRSSPDVQDTETYIKKRHSLPGANGRQGSPRIQRSTSQAHQNGKGNERKWQR